METKNNYGGAVEKVREGNVFAAAKAKHSQTPYIYPLMVAIIYKRGVVGA